jgi:hypothetical protein
MYLAREANETLQEDELEWQFNGEGLQIRNNAKTNISIVIIYNYSNVNTFTYHRRIFHTQPLAIVFRLHCLILTHVESYI